MLAFGNKNGDGYICDTHIVNKTIKQYYKITVFNVNYCCESYRNRSISNRKEKVNKSSYSNETLRILITFFHNETVNENSKRRFIGILQYFSNGNAKTRK